MIIQDYNYNYNNIKIGDKFLFRDIHHHYYQYNKFNQQIVKVKSINDYEIAVVNNYNDSVGIFKYLLGRYLIPLLEIDNLSVSERISVFCKIMRKPL